MNFPTEEQIEFVPVFTSSKHRCKRNFTVVFVQVVKKSALDVQNLLFFIYLVGSLPSPSPSPSPSSLLPGFIDVRIIDGYESEHILVKMPAIFSLVRYICYSRFGPLMNRISSFLRKLKFGWRGKKKPVVLEKIYFKETNRI